MPARQVGLWEATDDLIELTNNGFQFQFAKSVRNKDGTTTFNVVWRSASLAPRINIAWEPVYALNWSLDVPAEGLTVTVGGVWQVCDPGQTFDITKYGTFAPSSGGAADYLNIGSNNYGTGLHVVVGLKNSSGEFDVIYIDPVNLGLNMDAKYQPQETCRWWYETGSRSGSMITGAGTKKQDWDFSAPNPSTGKYYVSTTYKYAAGQWVNSPNPPPSIMVSGVLRPKAMMLESASTSALSNRITGIERSLELILGRLAAFGGPQFTMGGCYLGAINWNQGTSEATKSSTIDAIIEAMEANHRYFGSRSGDNIEFGPYGKPPADHHVPLGVSTDFENYVDGKPGVSGSGGVTWCGPQAAVNGFEEQPVQPQNDDIQHKKAQALRFLQEHLNGTA